MMKVEDLYCDTITYKPRDFDFSEEEYGGTWDIALDLTEEEEESEEFYPMMNYLYPLPPTFEKDMEKRFGKDWRRKIKEKLVCTTVVYLYEEGRYFLALTGGGMDLSWEICESYINLGYLPPFHFCNLPRLADKKMDRKNRRIVRACLRTVKMIQMRAKEIEEHLKSLLKEKTL